VNSGALDGCLVQGNEATNGGGGVFFSAASSDFPLDFGAFRASDTVFLDNVSGGDGGGAYVVVSNCCAPAAAAAATFERVLVAGNEAGGDGGGLAIVGSTCLSLIPSHNTLRDVTVVDNAAGGTGVDVYFDDTCGLIENAIVWGNGASGLDGFFGPDTVRYSDVEGWTGGGTGNVDADPLFFDAANGLYQLNAGSPCAHAGDPSDPADPDGSPADIGFYLYPWYDLGNGLAGSAGIPTLAGSGPLIAGEAAALVLSGALPNATGVFLVLGVTRVSAPFKGGVLEPSPDVLIGGLPTDGSGGLALPFAWPVLPPGVPLYWQYWIPDPGGPFGWAASNGLASTTP